MVHPCLQLGKLAVYFNIDKLARRLYVDYVQGDCTPFVF